MLGAARAGNVAQYLSSYEGSIQASLRESVQESSEAAFAKYLQESNAAIKGVAVGAPQDVGENKADLRVEYVYQDRNEVQTIRLQKTTAGWKITRVDGAERVKTLVPYGTPIR
jgi:hypothetical protein